MTTKRLLIALAHPDDEAFALGGLIGKYVSEGVEVYYILGTKGNRGTVAPEYIEKHGSIEAVRDFEMNCAQEVLKFTQIFKLGYGDSGMMGSADNDDPECLWKQDEIEVAGRILGIIQEVKPQVIICDNPFGGYGHPDHIMMHRATTRAFFAAHEGAPSYRPQKLYYTTRRTRQLTQRIWMLRLQRKNPRKQGRNQDIDLITIRGNIPAHHAQINVSAWRKIWRDASQCHASQLGQQPPNAPWRRWWREVEPLYTLLYRRYPEALPRQRKESDLFEGVTIP